MFFHILVAKEISGSSCCKDQIVVRNFTDRSLENILFSKHATHLRQAEIEIFASVEKLSEGERDATGFNARRSHLIDEWRELVIIVTVNQHHLKVGVFKFVSQLQAAEATTNDDHTLFVGFGNIESHIAKREIRENCSSVPQRRSPVIEFLCFKVKALR